MKSTNCLSCAKKQSYPLCSTCKTDPYLVEEARQKLAQYQDSVTLKTMYSRNFPEITNVNTNKFWDGKLRALQQLSEQDGLTNDRINFASSFVPNNKAVVLDVGAGYGFLEEVLNKNDKLTIHGIDISSHGIRLLSKRFPRGEFKIGIVHKIPYPDSYFDVVFVLELLEHIPPSLVLSAYKEIRRVLKDGGALIVSVPLNEGLKYKSDNPSGHVRDYSPALILEELKLVQFEIQRFKVFYAFRNFYTIKNFLQKIFWSRWKPNDIVVEARKSF